ncbi:MAG: hypothetical protein HUU35_07290, partial [Armatimonadetes bacterium]|nr:hypothetical protein [Armatimonadota bacterium]
PELTLGLFGQLPGALADYDCRVSVDGNPIPPQTLAVGPRLVVKLAGLPLGDHRLTAVVSRRGAAEAVVQGSWPISLVAPPKVDPGGLKQLNNLAAEVLNQPLTADPRPLECRFVNPREGWVFFGLETAAPGAEVAVDGQTVITATTPRLEAFRELAAGEHSLTIKGSAGPGRLVVRAIAEIFDYPPAADSQVRENGSYNWAFMHRHILPAVTTLNGGNLPADALAESEAMGLKWLANFNVAPVDDPADVQRRMEAHPGLTQPQYDGLTSDELFFGRASIDNYTKALWAVQNPQDKLIYTWVVGKPAIAGLHTDFISASVNASRGKGRLLYEAYCHPQDDEATARAYLDNFVTDTMRALKRFYPGVEAGTGIIFGNFNQMPIISLEHNPAVDFKYFLDMQVNLIANHPEFANLATTGYWGTYYGDEELARWSFLLMRHYVVEGRKEMLSERYGFRYLPGFVTNPDFAQGLTGWEVKPAAPESIQTATLPGYGQAVQGRWGGAGAGDKVCVMVRQAGAANQVAQRVRGLEVGKAYVLQFVTANRRDLADPKHTPGRHGLDVVLEGANLLPERGYVHIDRRKEARGRAPEQVGQINLHRVVFRATTAEQSIVFTDQAAAPGDELVLNFVQLKPYLE